MNEKKILIFGYGRIGKKVATICRFFNMQVYVYDKFIDNSEINNEFIAVNDLNENLEIMITFLYTFHLTIQTNP